MAEEKEALVQAIRQAEQKTSGEIRVYLERKTHKEIMARAQRVFEKLGMAQTEKRNGVLIYLLLEPRQLAVLGDRGIHEAVGTAFWKAAVSQIEAAFRRGDFLEGLVQAIKLLGEKLALYFPRETADKNELSDKILQH